MKPETAIKHLEVLIASGPMPKKIILNISPEGDVVIENHKVERFKTEADITQAAENQKV